MKNKWERERHYLLSLLQTRWGNGDCLCLHHLKSQVGGCHGLRWRMVCCAWRPTGAVLAGQTSHKGRTKRERDRENEGERGREKERAFPWFPVSVRECLLPQVCCTESSMRLWPRKAHYRFIKMPPNARLTSGETTHTHTAAHLHTCAKDVALALMRLPLYTNIHVP